MVGSNGCEPEPLRVQVVRAPTRSGVPDQTLQQYLLENGILKSAPPPVAGGLVEDFQTTFGIDCIYAPLFRENLNKNSVAGAPVNAIDVVLAGVKDRVRVIRELSWEIEFPSGVNAVPDDVRILMDAQVSALPGTMFFDSGPFTASNFVIGDVASPLTETFRKLLPYALLPGDTLTFRQTRAAAAILGSNISTIEEQYLLPFRPAGL